jgi:glycosyltransferase involved in cell wall biosynthesis
MRILFALGRPYVPEWLSGAELSAHTLLQSLVARGQRCEVVAAAAPGWRLAASRLRSAVSRRPLAYLDRRNGYVTHRAFEGHVARLAAERIAAFRPDLVVTALDESVAIAAEAVRTETPVLISILDNAYRWLDGPLPLSPLLGLIGNSRFTAGRALERFGVEPAVIYPCVRLADYRAERREPSLVTFVNPVYEKGLDKALRLAELLPHRRFQFVQCWILARPLAEENERPLRVVPNVTYRRRTRDMRSIYRQTSVLVVPSVWEEAFGRVILEAHASGIPVIATRIGGIPEALGRGGLLLQPEASPEEWARAVESILSDGALRTRLSAHARANAARPELDRECVASRFLEVAAAHVARCRA